MKTFFTVSDLNFLDDGENDSLSFIPTPDIKNKFSDKELLRRVFTENIAVVPEPPTYSDIVQKIMEANPQTPEEVDGITKSYPYEIISKAYDYKYKLWKKVGNGDIFRDDEIYYTDGTAGLLLEKIFSTLTSDTIEIFFSLKNYLIYAGEVNQPTITLYNNITTTTTTTYPLLQVRTTTADDVTAKFRLAYRKATNGTTLSAETKWYDAHETFNLKLKLTPAGIFLYNLDESTTTAIAEINSSLINFSNIRIFVNATNITQYSFASSLKLTKFKIINTSKNEILSSFNKI